MIDELKKSPLLNWSGTYPLASLAFYRICFGALMIYSISRFALNGWIRTFYIQPEFHFSYYGFDWLPYPNSTGIYALFIISFIGALGILLGMFYRISALLFFISFTYIELLDKTYYLNHYYFVSLIAFLLILIPANANYSLDAKFGLKKPLLFVPKWTISILIFQISIVYFYAGLSKLNYDWLFEAQPLKIWLNAASNWPIVGQLFTEDWVAYVFSWFALFYDLFIVLLLILNKTRTVGFILVFLFHFLTWLLFPIGVFPWVMMVGSLIFLGPEIHTKILKFIWPLGPDKSGAYTINSKVIQRTILPLFIMFQLVFPFRYILYNDHLFWKESGYRFGWRVMLMEKAGYANFYLKENGARFEIPNNKHLSLSQEKQMSTQPDMILQYADYLQKIYSDTTVEISGHTFTFARPNVYAEVYVTLNGRRSQLFVDKETNLSEIQYDLSERNWIEDFVE